MFKMEFSLIFVDWFVTRKRAITELIPHFYINIILSIADEPEETMAESAEVSADFESLEIAYISKWNQVSNILNETEVQKFAAKRKIFSGKVFSEDDGNCETERYRFIHALLVKQGIPNVFLRQKMNVWFSVIRRLIDCCNESPTMPDFCLSWFKLFRIFSSLFPLGFILKHIQPLIIYEIGLFNNQTNFNTLLLPCYTGALIGPLVAVSTECQQHFSLALREVRFFYAHNYIRNTSC